MNEAAFFYFFYLILKYENEKDIYYLFHSESKENLN